MPDSEFGSNSKKNYDQFQKHILQRCKTDTQNQNKFQKVSKMKETAEMTETKK